MTKTVTPTFMQVHSSILRRACDCGNHTVAGGECAECDKKDGTTLQRTTARNQPMHRVPPIVPDVLHSPGQALDVKTRAFMEPRFRHDFSQVRLHTDGKAAESARAVNAQAYTVGRDIVFGNSHVASDTRQGRELIAHELAHVVQQSRHAVPGTPQSYGDEHEPTETEANRIADRIIGGGPAGLVSVQPGPHPHCAR